MDRCVQLAITPYSAKYNTIDYPHLLYPLLHRSPNRASAPTVHRTHSASEAHRSSPDDLHSIVDIHNNAVITRCDNTL
jgi:hypothetical protein